MEIIEPVQCRFHDLRDTAISRMIANKTPIRLWRFSLDPYDDL